MGEFQSERPKPPSARNSSVLIIGLIAVATLVVAVIVLKKPAWKPFDVPGTEFRVQMRGQPKPTTQKIPTAIGEVEQKMWTVEGRNSSYMIATVDYPADVVGRSDPWKMLEGSRNGALSNANGTLVSESRLSYKGHPGLDITADVKNGPQNASMRGRIFLINARLVILLAVAPRGQLDEKDMQRFFGNAGNVN